MSGGTIEKLRNILGHSTVQVTERYMHLRPDAFTDRERALIGIDLQAGDATTVALPSPAAKASFRVA